MPALSPPAPASATAATEMQRAARDIRADHAPGTERFACWAAVAHWLDSVAARYLDCFASSGIEPADWNSAAEVASSYLRG